MKKFVLLLFLFSVALIALLAFKRNYEEKKIISPGSYKFSSSKREVISEIPIKETQKSIFIPYWSLNEKPVYLKDYNSVYFFGVAADEQGINREDQGYKKLPDFVNKTDAVKNKYLTIRMTDSAVNSKVLENTGAQRKIIEESVSLAQDYDFKGIVFDFEISALSFDSVVKEISVFYKDFYNTAGRNNLTFLITIYGDTFYRARPYDISFLSKNSDGILVMTYDFHKAGGNPGPNFPLNGQEKYGYDLKTMVKDFTQKVPPGKITVILGMFGYDWMVDDKNQPLSAAKPLSTSEIKNKFLVKCNFKDCLSTNDKESVETKISYIDSDNKKHIVWFEDEASAEQKVNFLRQNRINSVGYWAYSYF